MSSYNDLKTQKAKIFGSLSQFYFVVFGQSLEGGRKRAKELIEAENTKKILEVGVGTGLTFKYYPDGSEITGIDINEPMIKQSLKRSLEFPKLKIDLACQDATKLPYANSTFDCTYAPSVLSVVHDANAVFREMIRVTKPGGLIIAICYAQSHSFFDQMVARVAGRATEKYLGFHMRLHEDFFKGFEELHPLSKDAVNRVGPFSLSTLFSFKKKVN